MGTQESGGRVRGKGKGYNQSNFFKTPRRGSAQQCWQEVNDLRGEVSQLKEMIGSLVGVMAGSGKLSGHEFSDILSACGISTANQRGRHTSGQASHGHSSHVDSARMHDDAYVTDIQTPTAPVHVAPPSDPTPSIPNEVLIIIQSYKV